MTLPNLFLHRFNFTPIPLQKNLDRPIGLIHRVTRHGIALRDLPHAVAKTHPLYLPTIGNPFGQHSMILPTSFPIFNPPRSFPT